MKISTTTQAAARKAKREQMTLYDEAVWFRSLGFTSLDLDLMSPIKCIRKPGWESFADEAMKADISFTTAHLPFDYPPQYDIKNRERFMLRTYHALDVCKRLGVKWAVIHPHTKATEDYDEENEFKNTVEFLEPFMEYAAKTGVGLAVENMLGPKDTEPGHRFCSTADEVIRVADHFSSGICWDTGHANISGIDQPKAIMMIGKRLKTLHINDNFGTDDLHIAPYTGLISWSGFLKALKDNNYSGDLNFEVNIKNMPFPLLETYLKHLSETGRFMITEGDLQ